MPDHPRFWYVRHGETDWNLTKRYQGQIENPLNETGRAQAARNGEVLRKLFADEQIDPGGVSFIASPFVRTRETMEIIRETMGLDPMAYSTEPRIIETSYGEWQGLLFDEVQELRRDEWEAREADPIGYVVPGGESYQMVIERVKPWLDALPGPAVVVGHGGIMRVVHYLLCGIAPEDMMKIPVRQDRIRLFEAGTVELL
ncbi:MAG: histidine phosphatase family protein [Rhodobiaceae bacterium]|nr:histidine phosphatase family protein [Rhodobiaceae bacterium]MCC0054767.1 histidine phosphatase family protein [Rhodobiaceae bacterium]